MDAVQKQLRLTQIAVENAKDAMFWVGRDGALHYVNEAACRLFGYTRDELLSLNVQALDPGCDTSRLGIEWQQFHRQRGAQFESQQRKKDGTLIPVDVTVTCLAFEGTEYCCATVRDLTERKRVEAALQQSELRLKTIVDSVLAGMMIIDAETRQIVDANPAALELMGRPKDTVVGAVCHSFVCPAELNRCPVMDLGQKVDNSERVLLAASGERVPILKSVVPIVLGGRQLLIENFVDVRQQKRVEQELTRRVAELDLARDIAERQARELAETRDQALEASRLKSAFLANMSHEIRTPMHAVLGMSELLNGTELTGEQREYGSGIHESAGALLNLLNDILDFSKIEAGRLALDRVCFSLDHELERLRTILAARARAKGIEIRCEVSPGTPVRLLGDPSRLRQILLNLAGNGVKFTSRGHVHVRAELDSRTADAVVLRFSVVDTGIGIEPEHRARLFEPFVQGDGSAHRRYGGTGLGLAISRQLVQLMGGSIGLESEVGRGSTFWFTAAFEQAQEAGTRAGLCVQQQALSSPECRCDRASQPGRILVVEDNAVNRKIALRMLDRIGYAADAVSSGQEALEAVAQGDYLVVLMDVQMPDMDGFETTAAIRRRESEKHIPIIAMTANAMSGDRDKCLAAGMDDYLGKPVQSATLKATLEKWR